MNKQGLPKTKISLWRIVTLVCIILGMGCIGYAVLNIASSKTAAISTYAGSSVAPASAQGERRAAAERTESTENGQLMDAPVSDISLYPVYPSEGDVIGSLSMPALALELPIIQGTGTEDLKKGVGHFLQSVLPGEEDNCVLSGHRDTVFASLGELKIGDQLVVQTSAGIFSYEVSGTRIVDKDDRTVIVPTDHAVLTLTTCYPFLYIGTAPDRYIVSADLVT